MFYYAQLNENNICIGVSQLSGEVNAPNMILLENQDALLLGKKYNKGAWEENPMPEPVPTDQDAINANLLATMNEILLKLSGGETSV